MTRYQFKREGEVVEVDVEWVGDGYRAQIGDQKWKIKPASPAKESEESVEKVETGGAPKRRKRARKPHAESTAGGEVVAPISGKIIELLAGKGERVEKGEVLLKLEAMKLETEVPAASSGTVQEVFVNEGENIDEGDKILRLEGE